jgi:two-component system response regulator GlrR
MSELGAQREAPSAAEAGAGFERPSGRRRSDRVVGASRASQELIDQALFCARSEQPVVISGPAGSGKDHLARAIHAWGGRASGPFVAWSCAVVETAQHARELFGSGSGTNPGSPDDYPGALSRAAGGTVVLDAIESLHQAVRAPLGRAIGEGRFRREGDGGTVALRARVIALARRPLESPPFGEGAHLEIRVPSLAERREDILPLAAHFLRLYSEESGVRPIGFTSDARSALLAEPWEGNVRELAERVRQAVKLAGDGAISAEALLLAADSDDVPSFKDAKRAFETRYVIGLLRRCGGNISRAARLAKKDRKDFYDVIRRTGVDPSEFR